MKVHSYFWALVLSLFLASWFIIRIDRRTNYQDYYPEFFNQTSQKWIEPRDVLSIWDTMVEEVGPIINQTNAWSRLQRKLITWTMMNPVVPDWTYDDQRQALLAAQPHADNQTCTRHLAWIRHQLDLIEPEEDLATMKGVEFEQLNLLLESFGQPEARSMVKANRHWLGSEVGCEHTRLHQGTIETRYCLGYARYPNWNAEGVKSSNFRVGLCLPRACHMQQFEQNREQIEFLMKFYWPERYKRSLVLDSIYCQPDRDSELSKMKPEAKVLLVLLAGWFSVILLASFLYERSRIVKAKYNKLRSRNRTATMRGNQPGAEVGENLADWSVTKALSIQNSLGKLQATAPLEVNPRVDLRSLNFVKVVMSFSIVLGHSIALNVFHGRGDLLNWMTNAIRLSLSLGRFNDIYFIFCGLLMSHNILSATNSKQRANPLVWLQSNISILIRLAPLFLVTFWFNRLIAHQLSSSPWWDNNMGGSFRTICTRDPWWKSIPYLGNFGTQEMPHCNVPSWFVVCYAQLALLVPLILLAIERLPNDRSRNMLIAFTLTISCLHNCIKLLQQRVFTGEMINLLSGFVVVFVDKYEPTGYFDALARMSCVAVGCLLGYHLNKYKSNSKMEWPSWLSSRKTNTLVGALWLAIFVMPVAMHQMTLGTNFRPQIGLVVALNGITCLVWIILNSILTVNLVTTFKNSIFVRFMQHDFWSSFNKLGLAISLVHFEVLNYPIVAHEQSVSHVFMLDILKTFAFGVCVSIPLALLVHVFIDQPIRNLMDRAIRKMKCTKKK